ncbi:hypothetical protein, partial [Xanthomonas hortorum]|uniref:hypothetical protein n=1 Tax=Xanthomonas hortorum TaxID=56454 RepID=UPI001B87711F
DQPVGGILRHRRHAGGTGHSRHVFALTPISISTGRAAERQRSRPAPRELRLNGCIRPKDEHIMFRPPILQRDLPSRKGFTATPLLATFGRRNPIHITVLSSLFALP